MASIIPNTIHTVKQTIMGSQGDKIADLAQDTIEPTKNTKVTSDWGVRQSNNDHWLSVTNPNHTGPALLEDSYGREKVSLVTCIGGPSSLVVSSPHVPD